MWLTFPLTLATLARQGLQTFVLPRTSDRRQTFFKNNLTKITVVDDFNSIYLHEELILPFGADPIASVLLGQIQAMIGNRLQIFKVILTRILATAHPKRSGNTQRRAVTQQNFAAIDPDTDPFSNRLRFF